MKLPLAEMILFYFLNLQITLITFEGISHTAEYGDNSTEINVNLFISISISILEYPFVSKVGQISEPHLLEERKIFR